VSDVDDDTVRDLMRVTAKLFDLPLTDDNAPVVELHLRIATKMAALVMDFPLGDEAEQAPVFTP
jgi:hypothetical protein